MKRSKYSESQIVFAIKQVETGDACPRGLSQDGHQRDNSLQLEEEIWWPWDIGITQTKEPRGGEFTVEEAGGRPEP